jgi:DNA primase
MLSFLTMHPDRWQRHSHVALCGVAPLAMMWMLEQDPGIREMALCLDNDAAGIAAAAKLSTILKQAGHENVSRLFPECKDWNEQLCESFRNEPEEELVMRM